MPKKDGTFRLIHNLSSPEGNSLNDTIPTEFSTVHYQTLNDAIDLILDLGAGSFLAKSDIRSAFRLIPVHPEDFHLLGFTWQGKYYYDRSLPMGASSSCFLFELFSSALVLLLSFICISVMFRMIFYSYFHVYQKIHFHFSNLCI